MTLKKFSEQKKYKNIALEESPQENNWDRHQNLYILPGIFVHSLNLINSNGIHEWSQCFCLHYLNQISLHIPIEPFESDFCN